MVPRAHFSSVRLRLRAIPGDLPQWLASAGGSQEPASARGEKTNKRATRSAPRIQVVSPISICLSPAAAVAKRGAVTLLLSFGPFAFGRPAKWAPNLRRERRVAPTTTSAAQLGLALFVCLRPRAKFISRLFTTTAFH